MSTPLVNMSKLYPKCQYFVGAPLLSSTALIHLGMEFTRASKAVAGILFHSSIMTSRSCWMLDTWCFSTFRLRMPHMCSIGFRSGDILGHFITFTFSFISKAVSSSSARQCHLHQQGSVIFISKAVSSWRGVWGGYYVGKLPFGTVSEGRASSSASECHSTCWNHVTQPQTMKLPPPCLTVSKAQFSWYSSPGRRHTCWTPCESNKSTLDSSDHRTCSSNSWSWPGCLQQTVCRLFCEPASEEASEEASCWDDGHANQLVPVCGVWSEHWESDLPLLQPLKQCCQHSCVCFSKPASAPNAQHKDSTSLIDPCEACFEWNPSWKTSVWPWPLYRNCNCSRLLPNFLYPRPSLWRATIVILKSSESSLPRGAMLNIQWSVWENCTQRSF